MISSDVSIPDYLKNKNKIKIKWTGQNKNIASINEKYNAPAKDLIHNIEAEQQHHL